MAGYGADLVNLVDARIASHREKTRSVGTFVGMDSGYAMVAFDGSALALPCKYAAGVALTLTDIRVLVELYGSDWVVTGTFARTGKQLVDVQKAALNATTALTATTATDLPGTTVTINTAMPNARWVAKYAADFEITTAGTNFRCILQLSAPFGIGYPQAIWDPSNVAANGRSAVGNHASDVLADPGSYTFKLQASRAAAGTAVGRVLPGHTNLLVELYE